MIRIGITLEGRDPIDALFGRMRLMDLKPLALQIEKRLVEGNHEGLDAGTDAQGATFAPLAPSTLKDRRRGAGGPMIPVSPGRRFIEGFQSTTEPRGDHAYAVVGSWDGVSRFHRVSARIPGSDRRRPARDVVGVRPATWALISQDVHDFTERQLRL